MSYNAAAPLGSRYSYTGNGQTQQVVVGNGVTQAANVTLPEVAPLLNQLDQMIAPRPPVVFSTHFDTVPPFFSSRTDNGRIYGRGSCDAKGILAAQVAASERLRAEGETRVGLLFVVGEERGSDGARVANAAADGCAYLIDGEPTDLRLGLATRGVLRLKLRAQGRAAHSAFPERGESAIDKLLDTLIAGVRA